MDDPTPEPGTDLLERLIVHVGERGRQGQVARQFARWLVAPANAVPQVKAQVVAQEGYVSHQPFGHGVARGIELVLRGVR